MSGRQVQIGDPCAVPRELAQVGADAAADLEHVLPGVLVELHQRGHPRRVDTVAMGLNFLEPLQRMRFGRLRVVCPDRVVVPLVLDLLFVSIARRHAAGIYRGGRSRLELLTHEPPHIADVP